MKQFFAYIRVSTSKQGEKGVSLQEQRDAINRYAQRYGLSIAQWFEERETAAKRGRPVFSDMLKLLRKGKVQGVIIHKIDRSARNLKDWADLGELIDAGIEVHFANESLDLNTRGGRLSADIQAVVAADYIRNLREETKKGFYGRLKQGIYPLPAPIGYLDQGKGKPKEPDPVVAPLVAETFELYAGGQYSLKRLIEEMHRRGLRNRRGDRLSLSGISTLLNNPFYMGMIRIEKTRELFPGSHRPLVSKALFDRVQRILRGKTNDRLSRHGFCFRRMVRCKSCSYSLIGELQKGHVYYRCHTPRCPTKTIRAELVEEAILTRFEPLQLSADEVHYAQEWIRKQQAKAELWRDRELQACRLRFDQVRNRLGRLTDAFVDGLLEQRLFEERKNALLLEERDLQERLGGLERGNEDVLKKLEEFLELAKSALLTYKLALPEEKRPLVQQMTSNLKASEKNVDVELKLPFRLIAERPKTSCGAPYRDVPRTWNKILSQVVAYISQQPPDHLTRAP